jgi:flagellar motility protein MotE (MotC chaperone)
MVDQEQVEQMQKQLEQAKSVIQSQEEEMRKLRKGADDTMEAFVELHWRKCDS